MTLDIRDLLAITAVDGGFRAGRGQRNFSGVVYGGQLLGQALMAATAGTPPDQVAHSVHAHFLSPGDAAEPVAYAVDVLRESPSSSVRRVEARQGERLLFHAVCAFSREREAIWAHEAPPPPDVAPPEACPDIVDFVHANTHRLPEAAVRVFGERFPIERRLPGAEEFFFGGDDAPRRPVWLRIPTAVGVDDDAQRRCLLAYLSDAWVARVAMKPHAHIAEAPRTRIMSLDHALWIHRAASPADWLLYITESPYAGHGRGLGRGLLYDRAGRLVATAAQEAVMIPGA